VFWHASAVHQSKRPVSSFGNEDGPIEQPDRLNRLTVLTAARVGNRVEMGLEAISLLLEVELPGTSKNGVL